MSHVATRIDSAKCIIRGFDPANIMEWTYINLDGTDYTA